MCDYTGHHFGASYEDACCIDGYLWDLDSGDDGMLTSGGDIPCPQCNLTVYVANMADEAIDVALNDEVEPCEVLARWLLGARMRALHGLEGFAEAARQGQTNPIWFGGLGAGDPDTYPPLGRIAWPWPLPEAIASSLSAHDVLRLAALAGPPDPTFLPTPEGWRVRPLQAGEWS
jgi:hypothetical protein